MQEQADPGSVDAELSAAWLSIDRLIDGFIAFLPKFVIGAVVFALFLVFGWGLRVLILRFMSRRTAAANLGIVLSRLAQWALIFLGLLVAVTIMAPSVKPVDLLSLLGIGGVAIGFAFKDILQNFLAGILILLRQPFRIGDQIVVGAFEGTVEAIDTRATRLKTYDGRLVVIPNSDIYSTSVVVNTAYGIRRSEYDVGVGYGDDVRRASAMILEALRAAGGVLSDPQPDVIAWELAPSSVVIRARWWTGAAQAEVLRVRHEVIAAIKDRLTRAGIDLPFPTQVVLFHDQTEETDGDRARQREGWPAGHDAPRPRAAVRAVLAPADGNGDRR